MTYKPHFPFFGYVALSAMALGLLITIFGLGYLAGFTAAPQVKPVEEAVTLTPPDSTLPDIPPTQIEQAWDQGFKAGVDYQTWWCEGNEVVIPDLPTD